MRILGWAGSLLLIVGFVGCGPANDLDEGVPESAEYVPAPKINFAKPTRPSNKGQATKGAAAGASTEAKK